MKNSSRIVATVLREIEDLIKPGMSTQDLDDFAAKRIMEMGAVPSGGLDLVLKVYMAFLQVYVRVLIMR